MKSVLIGWLTLVLAANVATAAEAPPQTSWPETTWYVIESADGAAIGHASREMTREPTGRTIANRQDITLAAPNGPSTLASQHTVRKEDAAGRTLSIESVTQTGRNWSRIQARILEDRVEIVRTTPTDRWTTAIPLPPTTRFDGGDGLLASWDPVTTPRLAFDDFDLDSMAVERVVMEAVAGAALDPQGRVPVLRRQYDGDTLTGVARLLLDRDRRVVSVTQPMLGASITIRLADRETALAPHTPYRALNAVMTKSPYRISPTATRGHIRYRFAFRDGLAFTPPATGDQTVTIRPDGVSIDICRDCGPGLPADAASLADALKPTAWMQSDHPRLRAIAAPVARLRTSDARKMEILQRKAGAYITRVEFTGHYSALETMSRRAGDCTEAAVLLAALGRSAGIPTRVVNGLVYSRERYHGVSNVFMPHSWTLAWVDGRWRSYDLALDDFDSTHIALAVGDGDANSGRAAGQLASLLQWEGMAEVRTRPGT